MGNSHLDVRSGPIRVSSPSPGLTADNNPIDSLHSVHTHTPTHGLGHQGRIQDF